MATKQGICKNCGSLVMFDDRDDLCECVFCNCVFPSAEAEQILRNPGGYEFKNEKFEKQEGGKHYFSNPVMPDIVEKAVQREKTSKSQSKDVKIKPSEFEISPSDVKAPKKLVIGMAVGSALVVGIILAIAFPLFFSRKSLKDDITSGLGSALNLETITSSVEDDYKWESNIYGLSCQYIKLSFNAEIDSAAAQTLYSDYTKLRAEKRGDDSGDVEMYIYTPSTVYFVTKDGVQEDVQDHIETSATTEETTK